MAKKPSEVLKQVRQRTYLAKDFDALRQDILSYARLYFSEKNSDFSENSLGGLFLEMAAFIGDNMSFYLDHQFNELNIDSAVETNNIVNILKNNGVKIYGPSPSSVNCTFYIEVPAIIGADPNGNQTYIPLENSLPIIRQGTVVTSESGISFRLIDNIDFSQKKADGNYNATIKNGKINNQIVQTFIVSKTGKFLSGNEKSFYTSVGSFVSYRKIILPDPDIYQIVKVVDGFGNVYYEVNDLAEDVIYKATPNFGYDSHTSPSSLQLIPAPYRFIKNFDLASRLTTLTFGGGDALSLQDDVIPDPAEFAIPLPNTNSFNRKGINPQSLLTTRTLGVASSNTTFTISYRYGGGTSHNVSENSIGEITDLRMFFPKNPDPNLGQAVTNSTQVLNLEPARGGENIPSINDFKNLAAAIKNSQERIVTKEDLLARVYTIPSNFGRVFRAAIRQNIDNPLSTNLYVVGRDENGDLTTTTDTLKLNLAKYLNTYRLISDAIEILDCPIVNFQLSYSVIIDPEYVTEQVIQNINTELVNYFSVVNAQIDKPIYTAEIISILFSIDGVLSIPESGALKFTNLVGTINNKIYSDFYYDFKIGTLKQKGVIVPPPGGIFEMKYPSINIIGKSV